LRHTLGRELLELPAGTLDPPESPAECARRELEEETGYAAAELAPLLSFQTTPGFCDEVLHAFVATGLRKTAARCEPTERIEPVIMPLGEALGAVMDGRISDGKTIATLLYFERARRP
jgi:ADP-ribose pyrophosphatase